MPICDVAVILHASTVLTFFAYTIFKTLYRCVVNKSELRLKITMLFHEFYFSPKFSMSRKKKLKYQEKVDYFANKIN